MWTIPPRHISVGVDFGGASKAALAGAALLARQFSATLLAVHVEEIEAPPYFTVDQLDALERQRAHGRREAEGYLRSFAQGAAGTPVAVRVTSGSPSEVLVALGSETDLLVLGTHGRRGPSRWWLGSVAERMVRSFAGPVLVFHDQPLPRAGLFSQVVRVDTGGSEVGAAAYADLLASSFGGRLTVLPSHEVSRAGLRQMATCAVMSRAADRQHAELSETLLRTCQLPLLFVP